ncbi:stage II sporulation P family protein [Bacillus atrophaeus subsp. globigii]|uniref:Spore autolysin (Stage II sporulation) n=2 Tax=Bacillus atrophaeus TaxID=1452 RepID=A0ABM5LZ75_BACA1|nr:stage II sporulation protein P [Bacillus atrophaeus]AMR62082.1 stage II sporulation protein P [Bacillus subtilis subsp. globigii]ADP33146.1 spore autolysin (stage II sporulation) [Bacillus atrophaeus 1942]AIK47782.1 stage II sporulation P family protein [Bacillus atrophaeus subsp. globigii]KFK83259.1 stage II sporulation P family protein [Bacillus atrophaeus]MBG9761376.1 stage II sporulation protein P [Bacillus atrophaeus]
MRKKRRNRQIVVAVNGANAVKGIFLFIASLLVIFILSGVLTSLRPELRPSSNSLYGFADELPGDVFAHLLRMENHYFASDLSDTESSSFHLSRLSLKLATSINLEDPRSFLGRELPGFSQFDTEILVAGQGTDYTNMPSESPPPSEVMQEEKEANLAEIENQQTKKENTEQEPPKQTTGDRKVVYIYHTHNTESYLPLLKGETNPDMARHSKANVTLVGGMFGKALEAQGVGATVDKTDIQAKLNKKGLNYARSYDESRPVVKEALTKNKNLQYIIDIHRDSKRKKNTTTTIKGKSYARLAFVVGKKTANFEENYKLASELHKLMEKKYPGLSTGVFSKGSPGDNGVYNQDLNDRALLLEFGGVDNNLEELQHTADATADVFSELFWDAEKVNADSGDKKKQ